MPAAFFCSIRLTDRCDASMQRTQALGVSPDAPGFLLACTTCPPECLHRMASPAVVGCHVGTKGAAHGQYTTSERCSHVSPHLVWATGFLAGHGDDPFRPTPLGLSADCANRAPGNDCGAAGLLCLYSL